MDRISSISFRGFCLCILLYLAEIMGAIMYWRVIGNMNLFVLACTPVWPICQKIVYFYLVLQAEKGNEFLTQKKAS
jgi:hypothetical protein